MTHQKLAGKRALVTGSTRGLGRTMAESLAKEGVSIYVTGREQSAIDDSIRAIRALDVEAWGSPADLSLPAEVHALAERALAEAGPFDILVNNAGMSLPRPFWEATDETWDIEINTNVRAPFILTQHISKSMVEHAIQGRIVNVSTIGVFAAHKQQAVYDIAKGGVQALTRCMAYELGPYGITTNCVAPGAVAERPGVPPEHLQEDVIKQWGKNIPMGRVGKAEDIAWAVVSFCLPEAQWVTGQTLLVDGGHISYLP